MPRLFGTDGVRGEANTELTPILAFDIGCTAARVLAQTEHHQPTFCIGRDTRLSGEMLEAALVAGLTSQGADVVLCGVLPTPAVAFLARTQYDAGIVISASHNPYQSNGIKLFNHQGFKLSDALEDEIEREAAKPFAPGASIGRVRHDEDTARTAYINALWQTVSLDLSNVSLVVDCANGAAATTAETLFARLNPKRLTILSAAPDGVNINDNCGSTHLGTLAKTVVDGKFDLGIAFDGDADRCLCVDETGKPVDGDRIMALCAKHERALGRLSGDAFVATVMSNLGLHHWVRDNGLTMVIAPVGDRYVLEEMQKRCLDLGGEQSGHLIFLRHSTTGDGQLTALKLLDVLANADAPLSALLADIPQYPQVLLNLDCPNDRKHTLHKVPAVAAKIAEAEAKLGANGRILVRPSGTEALSRVMIEGEDETEITALAQGIVDEMKLALNG